MVCCQNEMSDWLVSNCVRRWRVKALWLFLYLKGVLGLLKVIGGIYS